MRASLLCFFFAVAAAACSGRAEGTGGGDNSAAANPNLRPLACVARDNAVCKDLTRTTNDEPPRTGALVWAQLHVGATAPDRAPTTPKVAVYDDGTMRRTPVLRNLTYTSTPPRGLLLAKVAAASVTQLRADVTALAESDFHGFFAPNETLPSKTDVNGFLSEPFDIVDVGGNTACMHTGAEPRSACKSPALTRLQTDLGALAAAAEVRWRDAQTGTVSLGAPMKVDGDWPLADERAVEGGSTFSPSEWSAIGTTGFYRLHNGDFVKVNFATSDGMRGTYVYLTRMAAVKLGDEAAALRDELLLNVDRYATSKGEWLGIELAADRFPAFKNREVALVSSAAGTQPYYLYAIEQLDVRREGEIALP
jgi:hypothetical protein